MWCKVRKDWRWVHCPKHSCTPCHNKVRVAYPVGFQCLPHDRLDIGDQGVGRGALRKAIPHVIGEDEHGSLEEEAEEQQQRAVAGAVTASELVWDE